MKLKVILYAYTQSVFSGRKIEKLLNDSIRMMWLSQNQKPSYKTINRFRVNPKIDALLESLFIQFHSQCLKQNLIDEQTIFIDNTKVGANAYRHDKYGFKRDFKLYECDDCSDCSLKHQCMNFNSKTNKKIMKNYNWEYFKSQINKKLSEPETKNIYSQRKIDVEPVFGFMKAILGFTRMSVRGLNKVKRELGFVLMALNIRKVVAQRAENNQKIYKKDNFYIISIEIVFFSLIQELYVPDSL